MLTIFGVLIGVLTWQEVRNEGNPTRVETQLAKIMVNHMQTLGVAASLELRWPEAVSGLFSAFDWMSADAQLFAFDCELSEDTFGSKFFSKIIIVMAFPPAVLLASSLVYKIWSTMYNIKPEIVEKWKMITYMVVLFLLHPSLSKIAMTVFSCEELPPDSGRWHLLADRNIMCFKGRHLLWIGIILPVLLLYSMGIPAYLFYLLWQNRDSLKKPGVRRQYGFLYSGYKLEFYYYEMVLMLRKVFMVVVTVLLQTAGPANQVPTAILFVVASLILHVALRPWQQEDLVMIETGSLTTQFATLFCGLYLIDPNIPDQRRVAFSVAIMLLNMLYILFFGWYFLGAVKGQVRAYRDQAVKGAEVIYHGAESAVLQLTRIDSWRKSWGGGLTGGVGSTSKARTIRKMKTKDMGKDESVEAAVKKTRKAAESAAASEWQTQLMDLPPGWFTAVTDDGETYYYNEESGATSWEKPELRDEDMKMRLEMGVIKESVGDEEDDGSLVLRSNPLPKSLRNSLRR